MRRKKQNHGGKKKSEASRENVPVLKKPVEKVNRGKCAAAETSPQVFTCLTLKAKKWRPLFVPVEAGVAG